MKKHKRKKRKDKMTIMNMKVMASRSGKIVLRAIEITQSIAAKKANLPTINPIANKRARVKARAVSQVSLVRSLKMKKWSINVRNVKGM